MMKNILEIQKQILEIKKKEYNICIDGLIVTTIDYFYKDISNRLKFPEYFSKSLDSLDEILNDLDWIDSENINIYIFNVESFLKKESENIKKDILELFREAASEWNEKKDLDKKVNFFIDNK